MSNQPFTLITWLDPLTGEADEERIPDAHVPLTLDAVVRTMNRIGEDRADLAPGEGAGFDPLCLREEQGGGAAAFIIQTRGLSHGDQMLIVGRIEHGV